MTNIAIPFVIVCSFNYLVRAMIVTKYMITLAPVSSDISACGDTAGSTDFCAARVTSDTCEPLTRDWCETRDMTLSGSYMIKQTIKLVPEITYMGSFSQPVPINMTVGSEVEMKFVVRSGWIYFRCDLLDADSNLVHMTRVETGGIRSAWGLQGGTYIDSTIVEPLYHYPDTEYTLTIRCDVSGYNIYLDGGYILTFNLSQLPANSITDILIVFKAIFGDLLSVSFKAGI